MEKFKKWPELFQLHFQLTNWSYISNCCHFFRTLRKTLNNDALALDCTYSSKEWIEWQTIIEEMWKQQVNKKVKEAEFRTLKDKRRVDFKL